MTIKEIEEMQKLLSESPESLKKYLEDQLFMKEHKQGIKKVKVQIRVNNNMKESTRKAFILSENLCLVKWGKEEIEDFKSFAGKLSLTHIKTGMKVATIRINKSNAIRLAKDMEKAADLNFKTSKELAHLNTEEQRKKILELSLDYLV